MNAHIAQSDGFKWTHFIVTALIMPVLFSFYLDHQRQNASISELQQSSAAVEASRFTAKDGLDVWQEIGKIREAMAALPQSADYDNKMDRIEDKIDEIMDRLARIEAGR
jgi:hypothetical protein